MPRRQQKPSALNPAQNTAPNPAAQTSFEDLLFPEGHRTGPSASGGAPGEPPQSQSRVRESLPPLVPPVPAVPHHLPVFGVKLVRVGSISVGEPCPPMNRPADVAAVLWDYLKDTDREHFALLLLDTRNHLIGLTTVSVGDLSSTLVHPREVFKPAILANAASVILAHNHPSSGDPHPSSEDIAVTRRLFEAGELLGIAVLDHVIIGGGSASAERYVSLKEKGYL